MPVLPLKFVLEHWPEIAASLGERSRKRTPQIDTYDSMIKFLVLDDRVTFVMMTERSRDGFVLERR